MSVAVEPDELTDWADMLSMIEDWLLHASDETIADYDDFSPWRLPIDRLIDILGNYTLRMHHLAEQAGPR